MHLSTVRARLLRNRAQRLWQGGQREAAMDLLGTGLVMLSAGKDLDRASFLVLKTTWDRDAEPALEEAVALLRALPLGLARDSWLAEALVLRGDGHRRAARYTQARRDLEDALAADAHPGLSPVQQVSPLTALGILEKDLGHYEAAGELYYRALALLDTARTPEASALAALHHNLAGLAHAQGDYAAAEAPARRAVELRQDARPPDPAGYAADLSVLGAVLAGLERWDEAANAIESACEIWASLRGPEDYEVAIQKHLLGTIRHAQGQLGEAEELLRWALATKQRLLGDQHPETAVLLNNLGTLYADQHRTAEARDAYTNALTVLAATLGHEHPSTIACQNNLTTLKAQTTDK